MTTYGTGTPDTTGSGDEGLKEKATDAAAEVGAGAKNVAGVAKDEASHVAHEAKSAARGLLSDARSQLTDQASTQKQRAADGLRSAGSQFSSMADSAESGPASDVVRSLSRRVDSAATWLSDREPEDIVQDVRSFARRNTGDHDMLTAMPRDIVATLEAHPVVPEGAADRFAGYGVLGLTFESGDVLAARRCAASSIGPGYTSVWHRAPERPWTFFQDVGSMAGCSRDFASGADRVERASIDATLFAPPSAASSVFRIDSSYVPAGCGDGAAVSPS